MAQQTLNASWVQESTLIMLIAVSNFEMILVSKIQEGIEIFYR